MDFPALKEPQDHMDLSMYLMKQKKTSLSVSPPIIISENNLSQVKRYIPKSWREPQLPSTCSNFPRGEKMIKEPLTYPPNHPIHFHIDSIQSLSMHGQLSEAFKSYSLLQLHSSSSILFARPISSLLFASANLKALPQGKQLHAHIISLGLHENPFLVSRLSSFYSTVGLISNAKTIVEDSSAKHALPWNYLISAYVRNGLWLNAILAYKKMLKKGCEADKFTYPSVLTACSEILDLDLGRVLHGSIEVSGLHHDLFIQNALISMYAKCGVMKVARQVFEQMSERDAIAWNSLISGFSSKGMWKECFELLDKMQLEGSMMNTITWNTIATANSQMGSHLEALELVARMRIRNLSIDSVSLVIGLNSCSRIGSLRPGKEIHGLAFRLHCHELDNVSNALITMYSRCKQIKLAYVLFRMKKYKSLISWNAMVAGFAGGNQEEETFVVFQEMMKSQIQPNHVTVMTILSLCARVTNVKYGRQLHCYITKNNFQNYKLVGNSLIDMYSKSGRILVAQRVFDTMSDYDRVSYTSMIAGYGMQGEGMMALDLFIKMTSSGIKPDGISMVAVLSACSYSGLVTQGNMLFEKMFVLYGVIPQIEHYSCMIDLFGRAGLLRNAEELINRMPFKPSTKILASLVRACRAHGNIEMGNRAAKRLLEMRSDDPCHYVLIANMFCYCGHEEELTRVQALMKEMGIVELYLFLQGLLEHMRDAGYIGKEDLGASDEVSYDGIVRPE